MKRNLNLLLLACFAVLLITSCSKTDDELLTPISANPVTGKNRFTTNIDGDEREYFVHVPKSYTGTSAVPVVFMLHGNTGNGEEFYNISGWREVGEDENIITVFPSSWRYCTTEGGVQSNATKWNVSPDASWTFCAGQKPRNDIKFLSTIVTELNNKYKIDNKRIYVAGFSNGGQMAAKCAVELSDKLAAVVESGGSFYLDTIYTPKRKLPILLQVGNEDYGTGNTGPAVPLSSLSYIISTPGLQIANHYIRTRAHVRTFGLNPAFTISGDTNSVSFANYIPAVGNGNAYEFKYLLIKGMGHVYPNGDNHWMEGARVNWAWMKQYSLP